MNATLPATAPTVHWNRRPPFRGTFSRLRAQAPSGARKAGGGGVPRVKPPATLSREVAA